MMEISTHLMLLILTIYGSTFNRVLCADTSLPCVVLEECDVVRALIENQNSSIAQNVLQRIGSKCQDIVLEFEFIKDKYRNNCNIQNYVSANILGQLVCGRNNDGSILVRCPNTYSDDNTNYAGLVINKFLLRICQLLKHISFKVH